jgi:hypothetical protein
LKPWIKHNNSVFFILGLDCVPALRGAQAEAGNAADDYAWGSFARLKAGSNGNADWLLTSRLV